MTSMWVRVAHVIALSLERSEREAVFGDFCELGRTPRQMATGVSGLVLRRQLASWMDWRPWFALIAVVWICPILAKLAGDLSQNLFPHLVIWLHHRLAYETGVSTAAMHAASWVQAAALMTWSWNCTYALGLLSRKTVRVQGVLFVALFVFHQRRLLEWFPKEWAWVPSLISLVTILLPAYYGVSQSLRCRAISLTRILPLAAWTIAITTLAFWAQEWGDAAMDNWQHGAPALTLLQLAARPDVWRLVAAHLLTAAALIGPALYLVPATMLKKQSLDQT